jgi:hypothetical protein
MPAVPRSSTAGQSAPVHSAGHAAASPQREARLRETAESVHIIMSQGINRLPTHADTLSTYQGVALPQPSRAVAYDLHETSLANAQRVACAAWCCTAVYGPLLIGETRLRRLARTRVYSQPSYRTPGCLQRQHIARPESSRGAGWIDCPRRHTRQQSNTDQQSSLRNR